MVATFPIDHQGIVRAAEEMISDYGSQALAKAKKRAQELRSEGFELRPSRLSTRRRAARLALLLLLVLPWLAVPKTAQAYLDPGTGSILLQIIIGGVVGLGVAGKLYWHRLRGLLGLDKKAPQEEPPSATK